MNPIHGLETLGIAMLFLAIAYALTLFIWYVVPIILLWLVDGIGNARRRWWIIAGGLLLVFIIGCFG